MILYSLTYILLGFGALAAVRTMILRIGAMLGACPDTCAAARAASVTITTGFAAIGAGGVIMVAAVMPLFPQTVFATFLLALGFVSLCLGLGFTHAIGTLRAVITDPKAQNRPARPAPAPFPDDAFAAPAV